MKHIKPEVIRKFREEFDIKVWSGYYDMESVEQFILEALSARNREIREWARERIDGELEDKGSEFMTARDYRRSGQNRILEDLIKFLQ